MKTFRRNRYAAGVGGCLLVLFVTLAFGFDGFVALNEAAELLFWMVVVFAFIGFCVRFFSAK